MGLLSEASPWAFPKSAIGPDRSGRRAMHREKHESLTWMGVIARDAIARAPALTARTMSYC
ncbi:hypothetical protein CNO08_16930 [Lysobacter capsici]|nr:hypothetical protein CNO08_16930 [Lysobacter capsici]